MQTSGRCMLLLVGWPQMLNVRCAGCANQPGSARTDSRFRFKLRNPVSISSKFQVRQYGYPLHERWSNCGHCHCRHCGAIWGWLAGLVHHLAQEPAAAAHACACAQGMISACWSTKRADVFSAMLFLYTAGPAAVGWGSSCGPHRLARCNFCWQCQ